MRKKYSIPSAIAVILASLLINYVNTHQSQTKTTNNSTPIPTFTQTAVIEGTSTPTVPTNGEKYQIIEVVDGDTFKVLINNKSQTVRLIGINTPETVDPRRPVECFGKEASNKAKELLSGKNVILEADQTQGDKDKYGRLLRYAYLEDGTSFNFKMISEGYAYEYTYNTPYKYQKQFKAAQVDAQKNKRGLWADGMCMK